jgi:hypothetical protein
MKTLALALLICLAAASACRATPAAHSPTAGPLVRIDWQEPRDLPPLLRNHCAYDRLSRRMYCSDHCGYEYQAYYCSPGSFGCCRIGYGYCDWNGLLRCHP